MDEFRAAAQYDDWIGTAAADDAGPDGIGFDEYLHAEGWIESSDFLVGIRVWSGENSPSQAGSELRVTAFVVSAENFDDARAALRLGIEVREKINHA